MKKGFTLIELLAVIVIITVVGLIALPTVTNKIKESKESSYKLQLENMKKAVETYGNKDRNILPKSQGVVVRITLGQLKAEGLLKEMKNPKTDKYFDDSLTLTIRKNGNNYIYEIDERTIKTRDSITNSPTIKLDGEVVEYYNIGDIYVESGISAFGYNGEIITDITNNASSLSLESAGVYQIVYVATDTNGVTTTAIRNIIVN